MWKSQLEKSYTYFVCKVNKSHQVYIPINQHVKFILYANPYLQYYNWYWVKNYNLFWLSKKCKISIIGTKETCFLCINYLLLDIEKSTIIQCTFQIHLNVLLLDQNFSLSTCYKVLLCTCFQPKFNHVNNSSIDMSNHRDAQFMSDYTFGLG